MSNHSFNPLIAKKLGVIEAIIINSFIFWTQTNAAKGKNFFDDRYWCFGTPEYFSRFFVYLTPRQIKYAFQKLKKSGVLIRGNFNQKGYDKTSWYSLSDSILAELNLDKTCLEPAPALIGQNCPIDRTKLSYGQDKIVLPIPTNKPDTKKDIKTTTNCKPASCSSSSFFPEATRKRLLDNKIDRDERDDETFLGECEIHVKEYSDKKYPVLQRANALVKLLAQLAEADILFRESRESGEEPPKTPVTRVAPVKETDQERANRQFVEYEREKEKNDSRYISSFLEAERQKVKNGLESKYV